jgi:hypothetical protein
MGRASRLTAGQTAATSGRRAACRDHAQPELAARDLTVSRSCRHAALPDVAAWAAASSWRSSPPWQPDAVSLGYVHARHRPL